MAVESLLYQIDNDSASLVISTDYGVPRILWYGAKLPPIKNPTSVMSITDIAVPQAKLDKVVPLTVFPHSGSGFNGPGAIAGHRSGQHFASVFTLERVDQDADTIEFVLRDTGAELLVRVSFSLHASSSVLTIRSSLENLGNSPYQLDKFASATLPAPSHFTDCMTLHGRWGLEFQQQRNAISATQLRIHNLTGRTSHEHFPGCVLGQPQFNAESGQVLGLHLGYSGNYELTVERLSSGEACAQIGVALLPGETSLAPGEVFNAPAAFACAANNLNQMSQRYHRFVRDQILPRWARQPRPIHANSWEALYFNHTEQALFELVEAAAASGAERFVLDDGWFHGRRDDTSGLGDWWVDKTIYPKGLHALVAHVRKHNMQFGLWFEPEMISPESQLYKEHPDWALHIDGVDTPLARNQLVLDLGRTEVREYLYNCIATLVDEYRIDYIKWDMNRDLVLPGSSGRAGVVAQTAGVYTLIDQLVKAFPALEIESCSSGGARADYGILARTGRVWASDCIDPIDRLVIQRGFSTFFPAEIMGAHVGHDVAHLTGRATSLQTRATVAMQGQFGYELDARKLSKEDAQQLALYANCYKRHRDWLADANAWTVATRDTALFVQGQVSADQSRSIWTIVVEKSLATTQPESIRLPGLSDKQYRVTAIGAETLTPYCKHMPAWLLESIVVSGAELSHIGLSLPVMPAQSALLIECIAEPT